jgi:hypothetical protein
MVPSDTSSERGFRGDDARATTAQDKNARTGREQPVPNQKPAATGLAQADTSQTAPGIVPAASDKKPGKGAKYFKSQSSGMSISVNNTDPNGTPSAEVVARFFPYAETFEGDTVRRGYLITDDKRVIERLSDDPTVEEITSSEYEKMIKRATPLGYPMA